MRPRPLLDYRPRVEPLEAKQPLSAGVSPTPSVLLPADGGTPGLPSSQPSNALDAAVGLTAHRPGAGTAAGMGITMDRITNPNRQNAVLVPPFKHVRVQGHPPVPGQVYNLLFLTVWNGTGRTFDASDGLTVRITNQTPAHAYPILTGNEQWKPGERIAFYVLTKKYYPLSPTESAGFEFNFVNDPRVVAIPGPSGIFLRLRYNPATFDKVLDTIIVNGPGARGHGLGLPDTAIWEIIPGNSVIPL